VPLSGAEIDLARSGVEDISGRRAGFNNGVPAGSEVVCYSDSIGVSGYIPEIRAVVPSDAENRAGEQPAVMPVPLGDFNGRREVVGHFNRVMFARFNDNGARGSVEYITVGCSNLGQHPCSGL
jgi:hypothetical protein